MRVPLAITFGKSPSVHYGHAVGLAQRLRGYRLTGTVKDPLHSVALSVSLADEAVWEQLRPLLRLVSAWRSASVKVAGQVVRFWTLSGRLAQVEACYAQKVRHGAGDGYCSGKDTPGAEASSFGCRFCKGVSRRADGSSRDSWIQFGALAPQHDSFRVDKATILTTLEQQTRADACLFCPAFRWQRVRADVNDLPDVIELGDDSKYAVTYSAIHPKKALGIQPKESAHGEGIVFGLEIDLQRREGKPTPARNVPDVRYADVAGQDAALAQLKNVVELPLKHAAYFEALRVEPQSGILLYGPPGNGKTLLAKAVATECQAHFELLSGPEILSRWVGQSEENLRRVFARARQLAPSVVLIDELDSLAPRRDGLSQHHEVQLLAQLLVLLDGLEARGRVAVVATTNRLQALDPAVCRPGRFDYHIEVPYPDQQGRAAILRVCLAKMKTRPGLPIEALAEATAGFSGAALAALCREAGLHAIQRGLTQGMAARRLVVCGQDLRHALTALGAKRVPAGP